MGGCDCEDCVGPLSPWDQREILAAIKELEKAFEIHEREAVGLNLFNAINKVIESIK